MTGGSRGRQAALPSRDYVDYYNAERRHRSLGGRTPLEVWRGDSTPVERIAPEQARWMLKARQERVIGNDGIHHRGRIYFASEFGGLVGERVEVAFMPHDLRTVDVYHDRRFLATAVEQHKLTEAQKQEALARRRADAAAIRRRAAKARRAARLRIAPITAAGEIDELGQRPAPASPPPGPGVLRLLGPNKTEQRSTTLQRSSSATNSESTLRTQTHDRHTRTR